jgi:hypothetical protein
MYLHFPSLLAALALASSALASSAFASPAIGAAYHKRQATATSSASLPPPPAESTGCVLHIDHYHCEGPATAAGSGGSATTPAPPAESTGCVLHNDHYDCEGAASGHEHMEEAQSHSDHAEHDHSAEIAAASGSIPPPPAESTGCEQHGDHYHCVGPASTASSSASSIARSSRASTSAAGTTSSPVSS